MSFSEGGPMAEATAGVAADAFVGDLSHAEEAALQAQAMAVAAEFENASRAAYEAAQDPNIDPSARAELMANAQQLKGLAMQASSMHPRAVAAGGLASLNATGTHAVNNSLSDRGQAAAYASYASGGAAYAASAAASSAPYYSSVASTGAMAASAYLVNEVAESWQNAEMERALKEDPKVVEESYKNVGNSKSEAMFNSALAELDRKIAAEDDPTQKAALLEQRTALEENRWNTLEGHTVDAYGNMVERNGDAMERVAGVLGEDPLLNEKLGAHVTGDNRKALSLVDAHNLLERQARGDALTTEEQAAIGRWEKAGVTNDIKQLGSEYIEERGRVAEADEGRIANELAGEGRQANENSPGTGKEEAPSQGQGQQNVAEEPARAAPAAVDASSGNTGSGDTSGTTGGDQEAAARVRDVETVKSAEAQGIDPATVGGEAERVQVAQQQSETTIGTPDSSGAPKVVATEQTAPAEARTAMDVARAQAAAAVAAPAAPAATPGADTESSAMADGRYHQVGASTDHAATAQQMQPQQQVAGYNRDDFARLLVGSEVASLLGALGVTGGMNVANDTLSPQQTYNSAHAQQQRYDAINQANGIG